MKVGILRLLCDPDAEHKVTYFTGASIWKFYMKERKKPPMKTLAYKTSDRKRQRLDRSTTVKVTGITDEHFAVRNFLSLSTHLLPVEVSRCSTGWFLRASDSNRRARAGAVYVKGLYVCDEGGMRKPVNLLRMNLNRDREIIADHDKLATTIGRLWQAVLKNESSLPMQERVLSREYLDIITKESEAYDYHCLTHFKANDARYLMEVIRSAVPDAFPYDREGDDHAQTVLMRQVLGKTPYPCSKQLYQLLKQNGDARTVAEAQESAFLKSSDAASGVSDLPISQVVKAFVKYVRCQETDIKFKTGSELKCFLKGKVFLVSEELVNVSFDQRHALKALNILELQLIQDTEGEKREEAM